MIKSRISYRWREKRKKERKKERKEGEEEKVSQLNLFEKIFFDLWWWWNFFK